MAQAYGEDWRASNVPPHNLNEEKEGAASWKPGVVPAEVGTVDWMLEVKAALGEIKQGIDRLQGDPEKPPSLASDDSVTVLEDLEKCNSSSAHHEAATTAAASTRRKPASAGSELSRWENLSEVEADVSERVLAGDDSPIHEGKIEGAPGRYWVFENDDEPKKHT